MPPRKKKDANIMPRIKIRNIGLGLNRNFALPSGNQDTVEKLGERTITLESPDKSFSFKKINDDPEMLLNSNILDINESVGLKNKESSLEQKFDNENDPIYDLDEGISELGNKATNNDREKVISGLVERGISRGIQNLTIKQSRAGIKNGY